MAQLTPTSWGSGRPTSGWRQRLHRVLGTQCAVCHRHQDNQLCRPCRTRFAAPRARCLGCATPVPQGTAHCGQCLTAPAAAGHGPLLVAVDYDFPWDQLIARLKFSAAVELADGLGGLLADTWLATGSDHPARRIDALVPVPLAPRRWRERGYNQAALLAQALARRTGLPVLDAVLTRHDTPAAQHTLGRAQRLRAPAGQYHCVQPAAVAGRRVALVDDVVTTGATLEAAAHALRAGGACEVQGWALARTPP